MIPLGTVDVSEVTEVSGRRGQIQTELLFYFSNLGRFPELPTPALKLFFMIKLIITAGSALP